VQLRQLQTQYQAFEEQARIHQFSPCSRLAGADMLRAHVQQGTYKAALHK